MCNLEMCAGCKGYFQCEPCVLIFKVLNHLAVRCRMSLLKPLKHTQILDFSVFHFLLAKRQDVLLALHRVADALQPTQCMPS